MWKCAFVFQEYKEISEIHPVLQAHSGVLKFQWKKRHAVEVVGVLLVEDVSDEILMTADI